MIIQEAIWVGLGGMLGALARWLVGLALTKVVSPDFPWATFTVNVLGCFLIGFWLSQTMNSTAPDQGGNMSFQRFAITGFLGAFTTFSAFTLDTLLLIKGGALFMGIFNIFLHWFFPLLAAGAGLLMGSNR